MSFFKSKVFKGIMATTLAITLVTGSVLAVGYSQGWFNSEESISSYGGLLVSEGENNGVSLTATKVTVPEGAEYESAYSITAEVTPSTATDTTIDLSLAFSGTEVSWGTASTGTVTDYVKLSTDSITSGGSVTLYCYQAFGEQIILTGTAEGAETGSTVSGTCTMDYAAKYTDVVLYDSYEGFKVGSDGTNTYNTFEYDGENYNGIFVFEAYHGSTYTVVDGFSSGSAQLTNNNYSIKIASIGSNDYSYTGYDLYSYSSNNLSSLSNRQTYVTGFYNGTTDFSALSSSEVKAMYEYYEALYEAGTSVITLEITLTGAETGNEYTFEYDVVFNPAGMYSYATAVQFSDNTLLF